MTDSSSFQVLRPLGKLEAYSSSRHVKGIYRCVVVSARYMNPPSSPGAADAAVFSAVAQLIVKHPMLRVGIIGEKTNDPKFVHIPEVDLWKQVAIRSIPAGEDYETGLSAVHAWAHDQLWSQVEAQPPWRIIVVRPDGMNPEFEDVVFSFHHALMDGTSAKNFHEELLTTLNQVDENADPPYVLKFPKPPVLPKAQEDLINYTTGIFFMGGILWGEFGPSFLQPAKAAVWTGAPINFNSPHKARVVPVDISAEVVSSLLSECRKHSSSITGLLHALCLASFARRLSAEEAPTLKAQTPINARRYLNMDPESEDTFRIAVSALIHEWPSAALNALRKPDADLDNLIWQHSKKIKDDLRTRTATLPADDAVSLLKYIPDWETYWAKKDGQERDYSWEISNVGVLKRAEGGKRSISRAMFTNGIMVAGGPLSLSVVSVTDGPLTAAISWNENVVPEELMQGLAEDLAAYTTRLHETGKFTI